MSIRLCLALAALAAGCVGVCADTPRCNTAPGQRSNQCPDSMPYCVDEKCSATAPTTSTSSSSGGMSSGASSSGEMPDAGACDFNGDPCTGDNLRSGDHVLLDPAYLARRGQRAWDGLGAAMRFPRLSGGARGHGMTLHHGNHTPRLVTVTVGTQGGGPRVEQFRLFADGTLEPRLVNTALTPPFFAPVAHVGPYPFLVGGLRVDGLESVLIQRVDSTTADDSPELVSPMVEGSTLLSARAYASVTTDRCLMYVTGGYAAVGSPLDTEILRVRGDSSLKHCGNTRYPDLPAPRDAHAALLQDGTLYLAGGYQEGAGTADGVALDLDGGVRMLPGALRGPRGAMAAVPLKGNRALLVGGGQVSDSREPDAGMSDTNLATTEVLGVSGGMLETALGPELAEGRAQVAAVATAAGILVSGGCGVAGTACRSNALDSMEFIPAGVSAFGAWQGGEADGGRHMAAAREGPVAIFHREKLYIGGGNDDGPAWEWFGAADGLGASLGSGGNMALPQRGACVYKNGDDAWIIGGMRAPSDGGVEAPAEIVHCSLAADEPLCTNTGLDLAYPRAWHACVVRDERLHVIGGNTPTGTVPPIETFELASTGAPTTTPPVVTQLDVGWPEAHAAWDGDDLVVLSPNSLTMPTDGIRAVVHFDDVTGVPALVGSAMATPPGRLGTSGLRLGNHVFFAGGAPSATGSPVGLHTWVDLGSPGAPRPGLPNAAPRTPVSRARMVRLWNAACLFGGTTGALDQANRPLSNHVQCLILIP